MQPRHYQVTIKVHEEGAHAEPLRTMKHSLKQIKTEATARSQKGPKGSEEARALSNERC
jgi:hypothetical protein